MTHWKPGPPVYLTQLHCENSEFLMDGETVLGQVVPTHDGKWHAMLCFGTYKSCDDAKNEVIASITANAREAARHLGYKDRSRSRRDSSLDRETIV